MSRLQLLILFSLASLIGISTFTAVVYHSHTEAANQHDLNYLHLYVAQINEQRKRGKSRDKTDLPGHIVHNKTYQIFIYNDTGINEHWLKPRPRFNLIYQDIPFDKIHQQDQLQGHFNVRGEDAHWIKLKLQHPAASIFFVHLDSDHWRSFSRIYGTPISILAIFIFWSAIWLAIILSRLFKRLQDKNDLLQNQAVEICQARDEAYAAAQAKSRFLANISHELRTPLTAILGFSENMLDSAKTSGSQTMPLQTITRNGHHLLHIINELLDLSKIEADKLQIECINFSILQLLQDVELLMHQQAEDKGLEFKINYSWPLPESIKSDPFRIKQILLNLCSNAIKFTSHGHVYINIRCQRNKKLVHLEVIDTGIGIAPEQQDKIFQAFAQADISTTRQYGGTGLGLSLSKLLAELMGGSITLTSKTGKGSRFTVTLPGSSLEHVKYISALGDHKLPTATENKPRYTLLKGRVLVADDAPDNRLLLSALLGKFGLQVTTVDNGQLALDTLANKEFDLILLDIQMPVLDGLQTIKQLQQQCYDKPVIALTANSLNEDRKICREAGFTDFIAKPIRFKILNKILSRYLEEV